MNKINFHFRIYFLAVLLCLLQITGNAQAPPGPKTVTGKVTDASGLPLEGVTIQVKDKKISTLSDKEGSYKLNLPALSGVISFSYIGYGSKSMRINANTSIYNIKLESNDNSMDDVVVIGYGSVRRKDVTGAVGVANVKDMQKAPVATFTEALSGRVAGLQVISGDGQPGADMQIVLRGANSVTQDNSPLFVIDGFPVEDPSAGAFNPEEVESIEVLKDASATAIYGARGANGVIIITTKKGKNGPPTVSYQGWAGTNKNLKWQELLSPYEFVKYQIEEDEAKFTPLYLNNGKTIESYRNQEGINWQKLVMREAFSHNHNIAMRGGNDKTKYSLSGSILDQDGVIINSGFRRYQGRAVIDQVISSKFKAGVNLNYSATKKYGRIVSTDMEEGATSSLMYSVWGYRPVTGREDLTEFIEEPLDEDLAGTVDYRMNPLISTRNEYNPLFTNTLIANTYLEYKPFPNLTFRTTGGLTRSDARKDVFNNSNTPSGNPKGSKGINGSITNTERNNWLNENTLSYIKTFNKVHSLNVVAGVTMQKQSRFVYGYESTMVPNEALGISGLREGVIDAINTVKTSNTLLSYLGRVMYGYKSRYLLTASFRADGSSKFLTGNKWAYFPSAAFAWRMKEESFMQNLKFLSDAKLRIGYGLTGNNRVGDFDYISSLQITNATAYTIGNEVLQGIVPNNLGNSQLKWETTGQFSMGLDLAFFNNRVSLTTDYYKKETRDLLLNATLAPSLGYLTGTKNIGKVSNEGIEFTLNTVNVQTSKFTWTSSFNISFNKNNVEQLNEGQASLPTRVAFSNYSNSNPYIAIPGHPIALFYGYMFDGIYQYSDFNKLANDTYVLKGDVVNNTQARDLIQPGSVKYRDINGDGKVDNNDLTIIGNPNPVHFGGFSNNFTYKGFDLNIFLQWSYGNDLLNANRYEFEGFTGRALFNLFKTVEDRWTPENPSNTLPRIDYEGPLVYSSRVIEDGSFLRLKTVAFGYTIPAAILKRAKIKTFRVFASAQNLLVTDKYSGLDPEVSVKPGALTPGFDFSNYPRARTITLGLDVTF